MLDLDAIAGDPRRWPAFLADTSVDGDAAFAFVAAACRRLPGLVDGLGAPVLDQFIEAIPAQQRTGKTWYRGSADAVWQCQHVINDERPDLVCIFGADHVYKMDVRQMLAFHESTHADATVAAIPVPR